MPFDSEHDPLFHELLQKHLRSLSAGNDELASLVEGFPRRLTDDELWQLVVLSLRNQVKHDTKKERDEWAQRFPSIRDRIETEFGTQTETVAPTIVRMEHPSGAPINSSNLNIGSTAGTKLPGVSSVRQYPPGSVFGQYEIIDELGRGGMGIVFRAKHRQSGALVALKMIATRSNIAEQLLQRFRREARTATKLNHPNIVAGVEAGEWEGTPFLALEFVPGKTLTDLVKERGPLALPFVLDLIIQAGRGLSYAHEQGVVHRDVKPSNILFNEETKQLKLLDLGLARIEKIVDELTQSAELTSTGAMFGTVDFMAPEQARDAKRADARADIYSLGCTLHYLLTAKMVFDAESMLQKIRLHRDSPIPRLNIAVPDVPAAVENAFAKMIAKEPGDRFQTMAEVIESLRLAQEVVAAERPDEALDTVSFSGVKIAKHTTQKPLWPVTLAGVSVAAILIVLGMIFWGQQNPSGKIVDGDNFLQADTAVASDEPASSELPVLAKSIVWTWPSDAPSPASSPLDSTAAQDLQKKWAEYLKVKPDELNSLGMAMMLIPPGEFDRGSPGDIFGMAAPGSPDQFSEYARPVRRVKMTQPYRMGSTEITVAQFREFITATNFKTEAERDGKGGWWYNERSEAFQSTDRTWNSTVLKFDDNDPVVFITRRDAEAFCGWLAQKEKAHYRLPTEAEWEHACRAGSPSIFAVTDSVSDLSHWAWANEYTNAPTDKRRDRPHTAAGKQPNPFGLYDMLGNVWEMCQDGYDAKFYSQGPDINPVAPAAAACVTRGGSFVEAWPTANPVVRQVGGGAWPNAGFRVVMELPTSPELEPSPALPMAVVGQPLGKRAFVSTPAAIAGLRSWSIETVGFRGGIASIDYSPTAKLVAASSSTDPVIRLYDDKLKLKKVLVGPAANVSSTAFSPDGRYVAATSWGSDWDNGTRIWETSTGRLVYSDVSGQWCSKLAWSPDSAQLAYAQSATSRIVDVRTGISRSLTGNHDHEVAWSPDGSRIAFRDNSWKIRIHDVATLSLLQELEIPGAHYTGPLGWSPLGTYFVVWKDTNDILLLDGKSFEQLKTFKPPFQPSQFLWSPDDKKLVFTGSKAIIWDIDQNVQASEVAVAGVAAWVTPGESLVFGRADGMLEIRSLSGLPEARSVDRGRPLSGFATLSPDGTEIATRVGSEITIWDAESGDSKSVLRGPYPKEAAMEWSPDGKRLAVWAGNDLDVVDRADGANIATCTGHIELIQTAAWSADAQQIVTTSTDKTVRIWDVVSGKELSKQLFEAIPYDAVWSHDGKNLAVNLPREMKFLTTDGLTIQSSLPTNGDYAFRGAGIHGVSWSPNDRYITSGTYADPPVLFDVLRGELDSLGPFLVTAPFIGSNAWSPSGEKLMASTTYQDAAIFDRRTGRVQTFFPGVRAQWHPDSRRVVAGLINNWELYGYDSERQQRTGILIPAIANAAGQSICIGSTGHYRGPAGSIVYAALTDAGEQVTYTPAQFERAFDWKNDPTKAGFLRLSDESTSPPSLPSVAKSVESSSPEVPTVELPAVASSSDAFGLMCLTKSTKPLASGEQWTIETMGHRGAVYSVAYSPSGEYVATAGDDAMVRLWDEQCNPVGILMGAAGPIRSLSWSRDGKYIASVGDDRRICWWDAPSRRLLNQVELPCDPVHITWSPDASALAVAARGGAYRLDTQTGATTEIALQLDGGVYLPAWSPDGERLALGYGSEIAFYDMKTMQPRGVSQTVPDVSSLVALEWSPRGDVLAGAYGTNSVLIGFWDASGKYLGQGHTETAPNTQRVRFSRDGKRVLTGGTGRTVYDVATRKAVSSVSRAGWADLAPDGNRVVVVQGNRPIIVDLMSGEELAAAPPLGSASGGTRYALSPDRSVLFANEGAELYTFDPETGNLRDRRTFEAWQSLFPSYDGAKLALKSENRLAVYSLAERTMREVPGHLRYIDFAAWSEDQKHLATVARDNTLRIWNVDSWEVEKTVPIDRHYDRSFEWQEGDRKLVARALDGAILDVDVASGTTTKRTGNPAPINLIRPLGVHADGQRGWTIMPGGVLRGQGTKGRGPLGSIILGLTRQQHATIDRSGNLRGSMLTDASLACVVVDPAGQQTTVPWNVFQKQYGWVNDEAKVSLLFPESGLEATEKSKLVNDFPNDRKAAEKAIALGGYVRIRVDGRTLQVTKAIDLPKQPFEVRWVELSGTQVTDTDLEILQGILSLNSLAIGSPQITNDALVRMGSHPHLRRLHLASSQCADGLDLSGFPELEELGLANLPLSDPFAPQLSALTRLRYLDLTNTKLTDAVAPALAELSGLQTLALFPTAGDATLKAIEATQLKSLGIVSSVFTADSADSLSKLTSLQSLTLDGQGLSDRHVEALANCPQLTSVSLSNGKLTDACGPTLAKLQSVRRLTLAGTEITDNALREIAKMKLDYLALSTVTGICGSGFDAFGESTLRELTIYGAKDSEELMSLRNAKKVQTFIISIDNPTARLIEALSELPDLSHIQLQPWPADANVSMANFKSLTSIMLYDAHLLKPSDFAAFATAPKLFKVHVYLGEWSAEHFSEVAKIPDLKNLVLQAITANQADLDAFKAQRPNCAVELVGCTIR